MRLSVPVAVWALRKEKSLTLAVIEPQFLGGLDSRLVITTNELAWL
jgi:hypothetical protein